MFAVACFIQSSSLLASFLAPVALQDSWLVVLFGIVICLSLIWLYKELMMLFPDKNLIQILEQTFGTVAGKIFGALYLWFFLTLTSLNLFDLGNLTKLTIMDETPIEVLAILCLLVSAVAIKQGVKLTTRYSTPFFVTSVIILVLTILLMFTQMNFQNFLPVLSQPAGKYIQGTHLISTVPFGELVIFLMIFPAVKIGRSKLTKFLFWGYIMGTLSVFAVIASDIAVLGNMLDLFALPHLIALRLVNLGPGLSRMEIFFIVVFILLLFFKITILFYVTVLAAAQLFNAKSFKHLVYVVGALIFAYGLTLYPDPVEHAQSVQKVTPFIWTIFELVIPLAVFIVAKIKKRPKPQKAEG